MTNSRATYDAIVVGGGGSGLAAALAIAERGGRVLVLEKQPQPGGTTGIAVGSFTAAGTRWQKQAGISDRVADHAEDAARFAPPEIERSNDAELRAWFLSEAAATLDWLERLGLSFFGPSPEPPNRVPRMHNVIPGAKAYIAAFQLALARRPAEILCDAEVLSLVQEAQRVTGVTARVGGEIREFRAARGVVLAAGDYAGNADMIGQYRGPEFREVEGINPHAGGDGHRMAAVAGAELVNMHVTYGPELRFVTNHREPFRQWLPATGWAGRLAARLAASLPRSVMRRFVKRLLVTWQHPEDSLFQYGAVLVNREGRRFVNELDSPRREIEVARQTGRVAFLLLDGRLAQQFSAWPHFISTAPDIAYAYVRDYQRLRPDVTHTGNTLADVARRAGVDPRGLEATVQALAANGPESQEPGDMPRIPRPPGLSWDRPPWLLMGPVKAYFTTTEGGVRIDRRLQALDARGNPIPGLYAVGQNGLGGMILWGHGLHIAWALTSGRLVGEQLMA